MRLALLRVSVLWLALAAGVQAAPWDLPPLDRVLNYQPRQHLQVFTADGVEIGAFGAERRFYVPIAKMPKLLKDAVIAVEDSRFREHAGIDPKGMARAALALLTGGMRQGASTITQQVARTFFLEQRFSAERKTREILIALEMERRLTKDQILELYMNEIFLGQRAYGFAAASQVYFGKPLDQLSIAETAMLAGLPQNPHYANPIANLEAATRRQRVVLERMRVTGVISAEQQAKARAEMLVIRTPGPSPVSAGHVAEMARLAVFERFGAQAYTMGLRVTTTLRAADQRAAWLALREGVLAHDRKGAWRGAEATETLPGGNATDGPESQRAAALALRDHRDDEMLRAAIVLAVSPREVRVQLASGERVTITGDSLRWALKSGRPASTLKRGAIVRVLAQGKGYVLAQWPQTEAAFVALDPLTGRVRALVGSFDFNRQPFDHVTQAWRQPGSSLKPLLYSAALEHGVMPSTVIDDAPFTAANGWSPANSDGRFEGPLTLREALARSRNLVSVRVLQQVGVGAARDWLAQFGLDPARQPTDLTLALGSGSVTPLQMAQAYGVFANGGYRVPPIVIERITDAQGRVLFEAPAASPLTEAQRAIPERNAFVIGTLLNDVTRVGTAARAQAALQRSDLYGKTGTTNDAVDAWFAGYQPGVVAVAWMGYSEPRSLGERESGGGLALPIWINAMTAILKWVPVVQPEPPPGLMRLGDDWVYDEALVLGYVQHIAEDGSVQRAQPFALPPVAAAPAASAPP
ncbi:MAG: PBP1A family penicillin-binding protein [Aquincola sp.]|nr:PBP1A family penicillin-binding protein [Aquincola sp.]MDH4288433.1 PBP1A family penicillin-binding protein [Aquincola sp.]MDH5329522.1 PBP1A family penicillin-binding protein [Aquincola sp.]